MLYVCSVKQPKTQFSNQKEAGLPRVVTAKAWSLAGKWWQKGRHAIEMAITYGIIACQKSMW